MNKPFYKVAATVVAFMIFALPAELSSREKRGVTLEITFKDGHYAAGELIAVKSDSLLMFTGRDESVGLAEIRSIRIVRKSKALLGAACGFLAGMAGTVIVSSSQKETDNPLTLFGQGMEVAGAAVTFGLGGIGIGLGAGALAGKDKTIQLEGKSDSELRRTLAYLRGKARVRDFK